MTDYSKMSDAEVNWNVAYHIGLKTVERAESGEFDPCNNPSDAWPIILNNLISMVWDCAEDSSAEWWNAVAQFDECSIQYQSNPLRAAMIVYLMMKESENA